MWHSIVVMQLTEVTVHYVVVHCLYVYILIITMKGVQYTVYNDNH